MRRRRRERVAPEEPFDLRSHDPARVEKIQEAFKKVAELPSDPKDKESATFGKLIEEGKLPITQTVSPGRSLTLLPV